MEWLSEGKEYIIIGVLVVIIPFGGIFSLGWAAPKIRQYFKSRKSK